jgi:hypothetical protein
MFSQTIHSGDDSLEIRANSYSVEGYERVPDQHWRHVDSNGHRHTYWTEEEPFPTLDKRARTIDAEYEDDDEWEEYFVCKECEEEVAPRYRSKYVAKEIKGRTEYILTTVRDVTEEEAQAWLREKGMLSE